MTRLQADKASSALWRVELFGKLRAVRSGTNPPFVIERFQTQKTALLFALLAQASPRPLTREALITRLWLEVSPSVARDRLSQALSWLRRQFETNCGLEPGAVIAADRETVAFAPDAVTTDLSSFYAMIRIARGGETETVSASQVTDCWEKAIASYGGTFLEGGR